MEELAYKNTCKLKRGIYFCFGQGHSIRWLDSIEQYTDPGNQGLEDQQARQEIMEEESRDYQELERAVFPDQNEEKEEGEEEKKKNKNKWLDCICGCKGCGQSPIPSPFPMILINDISCNSPI